MGYSTVDEPLLLSLCRPVAPILRCRPPPLSPHAAAVHGPAAQRFKFEEIQPHSPRSRACQPAPPLAILVAIVSTTATFHPVMPYVAGS